MNSAIPRTKFYTEGKIRKIVSEWNIKNFSLVLYDDAVLKSPLLAGNGDNWFLKLTYVRGYSSKTKSSNHLEISICRESSHFEAVVKCKISILDAGKQEIYFKESETQKVTSHAPIRWPQYVSKEFLFDNNNGLLLNDTLTILCDISIVEGIISEKGCSFKAPEYRLFDNLGLALESHKLCDVTINVCGREIRAHKLILIAGSEVFAAMFKHGMTEDRNSLVRVNDVEPEVFRAMLKFMYTGKTANLDKMAEGLLAAANKYALETLKVNCEEALTSKLGIENAVDILILADLHNAQHLKNAAVNYIRKNAAHVKETYSYKSMMAEHPLLAAEV